MPGWLSRNWSAEGRIAAPSTNLVVGVQLEDVVAMAGVEPDVPRRRPVAEDGAPRERPGHVRLPGGWQVLEIQAGMGLRREAGCDLAAQTRLLAVIPGERLPAEVFDELGGAVGGAGVDDDDLGIQGRQGAQRPLDDTGAVQDHHVHGQLHR